VYRLIKERISLIKPEEIHREISEKKERGGCPSFVE